MNVNTKTFSQGLNTVNNCDTNRLFFTPDDGCELYLPLWWTELSGATITSRETNALTCTVTNTTQGATGRVFSDDDEIQISAANSTALDFTSGNFTFKFWIKQGDQDEQQYIYWKANSSSNKGLYLAVSATGQAMLITFDGFGSDNTITTNGDVPIGSWCNLAFVRSGTAGTIYKNGVALTETSSGVHSNLSSAADEILHIGGRTAASAWFVGTMGEVVVHSRAESVAEIRDYISRTEWRYG